MTVETHPRRIVKLDPLWEGDKFQPPGQPRNPKTGEFLNTGGAVRSAVKGIAGSVPHPDTSTFTPREKRMSRWAKAKSLVDLRDGKGRFEKFLRRNLKKIGIDPYAVDLTKLDKHAAEHAKAMKLERNAAGESKFWFKSPCWTIRDVDFCVHVLLPAMMEDKYPERAKKLRATSPRWKDVKLVRKANPLWDGDGVQGAGQPRDRRGRWIGLPGPSSLKRIGAFDMPDGSIEVRATDKNDNQELLRTYKSKSAANKLVAEKIKEDASQYKRNQRSAAARKGHVRRQQRQREEGRKEAAEERQKGQEQIFGTTKPKKPASRAPLQQKQRAPRRKVTPVKISPMDRLENPGVPNRQQMDAAKKWAKENLPDNERKYSELIARLLQRRKTTQDPQIRGDMADRYGIPAGRLVQIERDTYDAMFPKQQRQQKAPDLKGGSAYITRPQIEAMEKLGVRKAFPESNPSSWHRPSRYFKINKGPQRGKWGKVSWNGHVEIVDEKEANREKVRSKVAWTKRAIENKERAQKLAAQRKKAQMSLDEMKESAAAQKQAKIDRAKRWAESEGLDPEDSYWWAMFWNDTSLLKSQEGKTETPLSVPLAEAVIRTKQDPALLEHLLSLPDISSRDIRGFRPGPKKVTRDDEDFEEASPETREDSPEWRARQRDIQIKHDRRAERREYRAYLKAHPGSNISFEKWKKKISKANIRWDGDGVQGIGQPRDRRGRWSENGAFAAASNVAGLVEAGVRQHHGSSPRRVAARTTGPFDHSKKKVKDDVKLPLQRGRQHHAEYNGKSVASKKLDPRAALYQRNNGTTKISNKRLAEIHKDRSSATAQERNLLLNARPYEKIDGDDLIRIWSARSRTFVKRHRYSIMADVIKEMVNDEGRKDPKARRGKQGHVQSRASAEKEAKKREAENAKRRENERNRIKQSDLQRVLDDFGVDGKAKCIFCGRPVNIETVSPEKIKPGGMNQIFGGKYVHGNMAPSHEKCNKKAGTAAEHKPEEYYDYMLDRFLKVYGEWIDQGYLTHVLKMHKKQLGDRWPG